MRVLREKLGKCGNEREFYEFHFSNMIVASALKCCDLFGLSECLRSGFGELLLGLKERNACGIKTA